MELIYMRSSRTKCLKQKNGLVTIMIEIKGKYNMARIFTDRLEEESASQIEELCNQEFAKNSKIRIMPDVHAGAGCSIGTTMTITDKIVPNLVGVDIGCGMETISIINKRLDLEKLDKVIYDKIPSGFNVRKTPHRNIEEIDLTNLRSLKAINLNRAEKSIGTLGGGNHFIEVNQDDEGTLYVVVHSGSRHLGLEVAKYYQQTGYNQLKRNNAEIEALPFSLAYVTGSLFNDYIHDMKIVQQFAELNPKL